ncbi:SIMPL domain-containing protein [Phormidium tenue FACHB-886]|nr:SIMPL domain-containing protein [Phormidium tenue FACHB-886]
MVKLRFLSLGLAIAATLPAGLAQAALTSSGLSSSSTEPAALEVAQLFYPPATPDQQVLMVVGHGQVKRAADKAEVAIVVVNYNPYAYSENPDAPPPPPQPLAQATLKPVLDAIAAAGVPADAIKVRIGSSQPSYNSSDPFSYYGEGSAVLQFDLTQPTTQQVERIMTAVEGAVSNRDELYLQDRYVSYTAASCDGLAQEAYVAAVADARERAQVLATAMNVELMEVPSVAESAGAFGLPFNPYAVSPCDLEDIPAAAAAGYTTPSYYDPSLPAEVTLQRDLYVTYPIER